MHEVRSAGLANDNQRLMLLTGASGFIGSAFLQLVLDHGWKVRVLTRKPRDWVAMDGLEIFEGDLVKTQDWTKAVQGVDVIVHTAAEVNNQSLMVDANLKGPLRLLEAAMRARVSRWVQLSSVGAYGAVHRGVVTETWPDRPVGIYELTKADFDLALQKAALQSGTDVCILRPSNVYGPQMRNRSIYQLMSMIRKGWFTYIGNQGASANYVHVHDVVQAMYLCLTNPVAANKTYIVSAWATMESMVNALAFGLGVPSPNKRLNERLAIWLAELMRIWPGCSLTPGRVRALSNRSQYCTKKIENELGWEISVPVEKGMQELTKSSLENGRSITS